MFVPTPENAVSQMSQHDCTTNTPYESRALCWKSWQPLVGRMLHSCHPWKMFLGNCLSHPLPFHFDFILQISDTLSSSWLRLCSLLQASVCAELRTWHPRHGFANHTCKRASSSLRVRVKNREGAWCIWMVEVDRLRFWQRGEGVDKLLGWAECRAWRVGSIRLGRNWQRSLNLFVDCARHRSVCWESNLAIDWLQASDVIQQLRDHSSVTGDDSSAKPRRLSSALHKLLNRVLARSFHMHIRHSRVHVLVICEKILFPYYPNLIHAFRKILITHSRCSREFKTELFQNNKHDLRVCEILKKIVSEIIWIFLKYVRHPGVSKDK